MSAFSLEPEKLRESCIDLVISTVPLQIDFPFICVSPIPQAQDMLLITRAIESISTQRTKEIAPKAAADTQEWQMSLEDIRSLTRTGDEIAQLLDHFLIKDISGVRTSESLLGQAAGLFAESILDRQVISQDLACREAVKSTFIPELGIYLLHCRTAAVLHCRVGYLRLDTPLTSGDDRIHGAMLLLAPQSGQDECVEVISRISMLLVEDKRFLQALQKGDADEGRTLAKKALIKYYQNQIIKKKGDGTL